MDFQHLHWIKLAIAISAVVLLVLFKVLANSPRKRFLLIPLALLAFISIFAYFDFGYYPKFGTFCNPHDLFHYYLGSKYSPELGYMNLYPAVVVAANENHGRLAHSRLRKMDTYAFMDASWVVGDAAKYKATFSELRWRDFRTDVSLFDTALGGRFAGVTEDMGYNATPAWNTLAHAITNHVPATARGLNFLVSFDLILVALTIAAVWFAFNVTTALFTLIFFCSCFCMSYTHIRGGFLRLDWVMCLVMAICALKKDYYKTAGALAGYAAMMRIFPAVFVFGLGAKCAWDFLKTKKLNKNYINFFASMAIVGAGLLLLSLWTEGFQHWRDFANKISLHNSFIAPLRVGFKYIFMMLPNISAQSWAAFEGARPHPIETLRMWWWLVQGSVIIASFFMVKNLDDYEAIAYGYVLAFFLTAPTFYYHVMLIIALFLFLPKRDTYPRLVGVITFFAISIAFYLLHPYLVPDIRHPLDKGFSFIMSCILLAVVLYMMGISALAKSTTSAASLPAASSPPPTKPRPKSPSPRKPAKDKTGTARNAAPPKNDSSLSKLLQRI